MAAEAARVAAIFRTPTAAKMAAAGSEYVVVGKKDEVIGSSPGNRPE